jgi:hypothetical protein
MGLTGEAACWPILLDAKQMQFAQGLMGRPVGARRFAYEPMLGRALQSRQHSQDTERQVQQYQQSEARLTDQFAKNYGLSQDQASEAARQHLVQQQQWEATFKAQRAETAARLGMERERLGLEERRLSAAGEAGPKLPAGYMPVQSASGVVAMPAPGTPDYAKVTDGESSLVAAGQNIDRLLDIFMGVEQTTPASKKIRVGGTGSELWGEKAKEMSTIRSSIMTAMGQMQNAGVLQVGDFERYEKLLPDPSTVGGLFSRNKSTWRRTRSCRTSSIRGWKTIARPTRGCCRPPHRARWPDEVSHGTAGGQSANRRGVRAARQPVGATQGRE